MKLGRFAAMGAAGALVVSLGGCAAGSPGTAATVDGRRITTTQLSDTTRAYNAVSARLGQEQGQQAQALPEAVILNALMRGEGASALARQQGKPVEGAADALLAGDPDYAAYVADPQAKPLFQALARADLVSRSMGEQQFESALAQVPHTINPRFGLTDFEQVSRNPQTGQPVLRSNSLSNPSRG